MLFFFLGQHVFTIAIIQTTSFFGGATTALVLYEIFPEQLASTVARVSFCMQYLLRHSFIQMIFFEMLDFVLQ
jgi:hypothetical protein